MPRSRACRPTTRWVPTSTSAGSCTPSHRTFLDESGLGRSRLNAVIEFSRPGGYPELLEIAKAHGYDLAREVLPEMYSYKTDTGLFLWVVSRRFRRAFLREKGAPLRRRH